MRRFLLLLLAFVLPLQMSWAAARVCDDGSSFAAAAAIAEHADGHGVVAHGDGDASDAGKTEKIADACCAAAHGCHGLHSIMGPADGFVLLSSASQPVAGSPPALADRGPPGRIERPQWLAA